jgi:hypothetical protein
MSLVRPFSCFCYNYNVLLAVFLVFLLNFFHICGKIP